MMIQQRSSRIDNSGHTSLLHYTGLNQSLRYILRVRVRLVVLLCSVLFSTLLNAQTTTTSDILRAATQDALYLRMSEQQDFFTNQKLDIPLIEEVELRTETHEFNPSLQEYAVRLKWNTPRQQRAQTQLNATEAELRIAKQQIYLEEELYRRYQLLLEAWYYQQEQALWTAQASWYADQEQLLKQRLSERGAEAYDKWLALQSDQLDYQEKGLALDATYEQLQQVLALDQLQWTDWPTIDDLPLMIDNAPVPPLRPELLRRNLDAQLVNNEYELEIAENSNPISFLQVRYQGEDENPSLNQQLTLGLGVTLPLRNADDVKIQYLELEAQDEQIDTERRQKNYLQAASAANQQFRSSLQHYNAMVQLHREFATQYGPQALLAQGLNEPELLLNAQGTLFQQKEEQLSHQYSIYKAYLEVLYYSGNMMQRPLRNWWSISGEQL